MATKAFIDRLLSTGGPWVIVEWTDDEGGVKEGGGGVMGPTK